MQHSPKSSLVCEWMPASTINFAMQQNFVPIVRRIMLRNTGAEDIRNVECTLRTDPEFALLWTIAIELIPAGETIELSSPDIRLSTSYLAQLTERVAGTMTLTVRQGEAKLVEEHATIALLAYDQWSGFTAVPEMVAAFVMPNHPLIATLLSEAAKHLNGAAPSDGIIPP